MESRKICYKPYKAHMWVLPLMFIGLIGFGAALFININSLRDFIPLFIIVIFTLLSTCMLLSGYVTNLVFDESGVSLNSNNHCILFLPWSEIKYAYPAVDIHGHGSFVLSPKSLEKKTITRLTNWSLAIPSAKKHGVIIVFFDGFQKSAEEVYEIIVKNVPDS